MKKTKQWGCRWKNKQSNAVEENKVTYMIKRLLPEFSLYRKFMCTDESNDKNKANLPHPHPL